MPKIAVDIVIFVMFLHMPVVLKDLEAWIESSFGLNLAIQNNLQLGLVLQIS